MKLRQFLLMLILLQTSIGFAQIRMNAYAGFGPALSLNTQNIPIGITQNDNEYALKGVRKNATYLAGVEAEKDLNSCFFVAGGVSYMYESNDYQLFVIPQLGTAEYSDDNQMDFTTTNHRLGVPLSVGARIGHFNIISGFDMNFSVVSKSTLDNAYEGYSYNPETVSFGWHTGARYDFGPVGFEVRYSQDFQNIGQGNSFGNQDILLYGSQARWMGILKYYF